MKIDIRDACPDDKDTITQFNVRMAAETEDRELNLALVRAGVAAVLADNSKGRYWVAEVAGEVVGQLLISYEWSDWRNGVFWWIQSVYIKPEYRRKGIFSSLYRHVESQARANALVCGIRLYFEDENKRAQTTYESLGMYKPGYQVMEIEFTKCEEPESA